MDSPLEPIVNSNDVFSVQSKYYGLIPVAFLLFIILIRMIVLCNTGQKTREPQQRRMYVGSRARPSLGTSPPTIYVSPANLPPPPKYEAMAPPSYEEVVGIHYPNYQPSVGQPIAIQPITQPILTAVAQSSSSQDTTNATVQPTTVTISSETRRTSVTVASQ